MDSEDLIRLLRGSVGECVGDSKSVAVAYSGGLDSSVVEALAREVTKTVCYTCAVVGSHDHRRAPISASESGFGLKVKELDRDGLRELVATASAALRTQDPLRIACAIPTIKVVKSCEEEVVLTGSGADELFGGYAKYLEDSDPSASMEKDLEKVLSETESIRMYGSDMGRLVENPFTAREVVTFSRNLPLERKIVCGERKVILREVAKSLGVLSYDSPKKAAQYSSGVMKEMRRMAKEQGMDLRSWTAETAARGRRIP